MPVIFSHIDRNQNGLCTLDEDSCLQEVRALQKLKDHPNAASWAKGPHKRIASSLQAVWNFGSCADLYFLSPLLHCPWNLKGHIATKSDEVRRFPSFSVAKNAGVVQNYPTNSYSFGFLWCQMEHYIWRCHFVVEACSSGSRTQRRFGLISYDFNSTSYCHFTLDQLRCEKFGAAILQGDPDTFVCISSCLPRIGYGDMMSWFSEVGIQVRCLSIWRHIWQAKLNFSIFLGWGMSSAEHLRFCAENCYCQNTGVLIYD